MSKNRRFFIFLKWHLENNEHISSFHKACKIEFVVLLAILTSLIHTVPSLADKLNAKCLLQIDGKTYLDDKCQFTSDGDGDFFSDQKILVTCPNGRDADTTSCYGYEQTVTRKGVFGYLFRGDDGVARLCWNEGEMRKAEPCFEGLTRR